jgi:hypothetical protein
MRFTAVVVLLLAASCRSATSPAGAFDVAIVVSPSSFRAGDSVSVAITVTNRTNETQTIDANNCPVAFEVINSEGTVVGPRPRVCSAVMLPKILAVGEQFVFTQTWSGDAAGSGVDSPPAMLATGTYWVRGRSFGAISNSSAVAVHMNP